MSHVIKRAICLLAATIYAIVGILILTRELESLFLIYSMGFSIIGVIVGFVSHKKRELDELEKTIFLRASNYTLFCLFCLGLLLYFLSLFMFSPDEKLIMRMRPDFSVVFLVTFATGALIYCGTLFVLHLYYHSPHRRITNKSGKNESE